MTRPYRSRSTDAVYLASLEPVTGLASCTCPGFANTAACWHTRDLIATVCPTPCPICGGVVELILDGLVGELVAPAFFTRGDDIRYRMVPKAFGACSACELCVEIRA